MAVEEQVHHFILKVDLGVNKYRLVTHPVLGSLYLSGGQF